MTKLAEPPVYIPPSISPALALDLALRLTGHFKETGAVRYLALVLMYLSWHFDESAPLGAYQMALQELPDDDGVTLLENLTHGPAYARRGVSLDLSRRSILQAQKAAKDWGELLTKPGLNVLRLHTRSLEIFDYLLSLEQNPESDPDAFLLLSSVQSILDSHGAGRPAPAPSVQPFSSAIAALNYLLQHTKSNEEGEPSALAQGVGLGIAIFEPMAAREALQKIPPQLGQDGNALHRHTLETLARDTGVRGVSQSPDGDPLAELYVRFPHFSKVVDFVSNALALAACGTEGSAVRFPPILLRGKPGTGKTFFAQELARVLGTAYFEKDLSVTSEAFVLTGLDSCYKNSKAGLVFDALVTGKTANPIIVLDEVDKSRSNAPHGSPIAAMYALLEPTSSRHFKDEFVGISLDASRVNWILTANDGPIPDPIISRLEVFEIDTPSLAQSRAIALSVWAEILATRLPQGHGFPSEMPEEILDCVSSSNPRLMGRALVHAAAAAARSKRKELATEDLKAGMVKYSSPAKRTIGF